MSDYNSQWKSWNNGGKFPIPAKMNKKRSKKPKKYKKRCK